MSPEEEYATAAAFLGPLASAALPSIRLVPERLRHVKHAFAPQWVESLWLPVDDERPPEQGVALADGAGFTRVTREDDRVREQQARPRTQVYESIHVHSDGWPRLVTLHLAGMLRREVVCTLYQSDAAARTLRPHLDNWFGVIVQMRGTKRWHIWQKQPMPDEIIMHAGDVLLLPKDMKHAVDTPSEPGHSLHMVFAVLDDPRSA
ncbi:MULTISPECIES: JmjC domain-containing protein [unclassified Streptomyces]|uniref:JmjC domain-containing protein n=1 Tax=unclassified Streptomyces TaxID=2593676 RepID=UPI0036264186